MGRPRHGSSSSTASAAPSAAVTVASKMAGRAPSRLLKPTSSMSSMSGSAGSLAPQPSALSSAAVPKAVEEDLESQARASLSLFGFGAPDSVNWSPVSASAAAAAASADGPGTGGALKVRVMERVCPIGTNAFLWSTMSSGDALAHDGDDAAASAVAGDPTGAGAEGNWDDESTAEWDVVSSAAGLGSVFASKVLQQYLVKCVAVVPSSLEEVVDLLVRSEREDMDMPMQHLVGVRASASAVVYRRKKKRPRRRNASSSHPQNNGSSTVGVNAASQRRMPSQASTLDCDSESSYSDSEVELDDDLTSLLDSGRGSARYRPTRTDSLDEERLIGTATAGPASANAGQLLSPTYMEDYRAAMATSGHQGNLSIKWVVGEKPSRMFASRATYCLLDYECILVNDWDEDADSSPMYVRTLQSCYSPQVQPWLDEVGGKPADLQPTGFMVRQARGREGYVEVQFVASILEKAQLPMASRRAKLRALCARISRLEEVLTSRRLSQSLLANAPQWVHNRERLGCRVCDAKFSISRRRHHCRLCGEVCCSDCCPKMDVALPDVGSTSVRVCIGCVQKRRRSCESVVSSSSSTMAPALSPSKTLAALAVTPPPAGHPSLRSSVSSPSPSEYNLSSSSSYGSVASSLGDRKHSLASSVFQKMKNTSMA